MTTLSAAGSPSVTVLMTVFNAGRFLDPAIRSIANQVFRDWEFVIVDDASTDGSVDVARAWAERDPRVRLIANPANKGQTACLNQGLREARGRWIARQDADDLSHPLRLTCQFERVTIQPELVLLGTSGRIIDENDRLVGLLDVPLTAEAIAWTAPFLNPFLHTAVLFQTERARELGGYDERFRIAQDYDLWSRLMAKYPVANLADRLVCYRHLNSSLSKAGKDRAFAEASQVSRREAAIRFTRPLTDAETALLGAFRQGLAAERRHEFWALYRSLVPVDELDSKERRRTESLLHLKVAGAMMGAPGACVAELLAALKCSPATTLGWLRERFL